MNSISVFTSNIINWSCIRNKKFEKASEEALECAKSVIKCWKCHNDKLEGDIKIECDKHKDYIDSHPDDDIRVTFKLFLFSVDEATVKEAFDSISNNVIAPSYSTVILSIPPTTKISQLLPVWNYLESLVNINKVWRLGVTDMGLQQLRVLCSHASVTPKINQLHNQMLCSIPSDIKLFANDNDIELLSHHDDIQNLSYTQLTGCFNSVLHNSRTSSSPRWKPAWIVKYSTIYANRSVIRSLGYLVKAYVANDNNDTPINDVSVRSQPPNSIGDDES